MIKNEDIKTFNNLVNQLNKLQNNLNSYNPKAKLCFYIGCDNNENDYCGLFLIDESNATSFKEEQWLEKVFIAGKKINHTEIYSRSDIERMIEKYEDKN